VSPRTAGGMAQVTGPAPEKGGGAGWGGRRRAAEVGEDAAGHERVTSGRTLIAR
jgi:hypothetical protein